MIVPITVGIPTKDRYEALSNTLLSLALQTVKPYEVIIVDDSDNVKNITEIPNIRYILQLFVFYGIKWRVVWGTHKGQHYSHQIIQDQATTNWIFRMDDDCVAEPEVLNYLWTHVGEHEDTNTKLGAIAPLVLMPNPERLPPALSLNSITDIFSAPNIQWFLFEDLKYVDHLNSTFLYRKGVAKFNLNLSKVAHREETIFTHEIKRAGYAVAVEGKARVWHFRQESGGIRSFPDPNLYAHDEEIFKAIVKSWNYKEDKDNKIVVLDNGLGDHYAFLHILPTLLSKYEKITIAACYPDIFFEFPQVKLISIAEAKLLYGDLGRWNLYDLMDNNKLPKNLIQAYNQLYNGTN